jgi:hypothetical protein
MFDSLHDFIINFGRATDLLVLTDHAGLRRDTCLRL